MSPDTSHPPTPPDRASHSPALSTTLPSTYYVQGPALGEFMEVQGVNKGAGGETKPQRLWVLILEALLVEEAFQFICPQPREKE